MAKQKAKPVNNPESELQITKRPNVTPAEEKTPDQSILSKPAPPLGMSLVASWGKKLK